MLLPALVAMRLVTVVWLPLAATISMVPHLVRTPTITNVLRRHNASKASAHNKASVLSRHNVRNKASALRANAPDIEKGKGSEPIISSEPFLSIESFYSNIKLNASE